MSDLLFSQQALSEYLSKPEHEYDMKNQTRRPYHFQCWMHVVKGHSQPIN